jgi:hypothetical protein
MGRLKKASKLAAHVYPSLSYMGTLNSGNPAPKALLTKEFAASALAA